MLSRSNEGLCRSRQVGQAGDRPQGVPVACLRENPGPPARAEGC